MLGNSTHGGTFPAGVACNSFAEPLADYCVEVARRLGLLPSSLVLAPDTLFFPAKIEPASPGSSRRFLPQGLPALALVGSAWGVQVAATSEPARRWTAPPKGSQARLRGPVTCGDKRTFHGGN